MPLEHALSKAIGVSEKRNSLGQRVLVLSFKYVDFELLLDDEVRERELAAFFGVQRPVKQDGKGPVKLPRFYK